MTLPVRVEGTRKRKHEQAERIENYKKTLDVPDILIGSRGQLLFQEMIDRWINAEMAEFDQV